VKALLYPIFYPIFFSVFLIPTVTNSQGLSTECPAPEGYRIVKVELQGLRQTHPTVIKHILENHEDSAFSCASWKLERDRLRDLDIFANVALTAQTSGDSVWLTYHFRELPPLLLLPNITETDQDGLSLGPTVVALNLLGTGSRMDLLAIFGGTTEYQAEISGRQIFGHPGEFDVAWTHVNSYNPYDSAKENSQRFKTEDFWPLIHSQHFGIIGYAESFYIQLNPDTLTFHDARMPLTLRPGGDWVPRVGAGFRWDTRDRAYLPRSGFFAETRLTENGGVLGGPANFWEELVDMRGYLPLSTRQGLVADGLYQYRYGVLGQNLGFYDIFHVGGANTLRGYSENAFEGQNECLLNAEYRFDALPEKVQFLGPWRLNYGVQLVAGVDAVSLWNGKSALQEEYHPAYYGGVDLLVPALERIRLEVGSRISRLDLQVDFGLFEKTTIQRYRNR